MESSTEFEIRTRFVLMTDKWDELQRYKIEKISGDVITLRPSSDVWNEGPTREIAASDVKHLFPYPYSLDVAITQRRIYLTAVHIRDLSSGLIGKSPGIKIETLKNELKEDSRFQKIPANFIEGCLRSLVASEQFTAKPCGRGRNRTYKIELSEERKWRERDREFAGTFANELQTLSERIRNLIRHTGTVGTYRETLLQTLLQKQLPERYHVATGFIHGCPRQLDVLIYDRIDYAPLFREANLVVVPSESVRAVIEVKTSLTKEELLSSLRLLEQVSQFDNLPPPFFRGIFAFESSVSADAIFDAVTNFYADGGDFFDEPDAQQGDITEPFDHLSSVCVLGHAYAQVEYLRDDKEQYVPTLLKASSAIGLNAQAALFTQHLLKYLNFGGLKPRVTNYIEQHLGADTQWQKHSQLTTTEYWGWGSYFDRDELGAGDEGVVETEQLIEDVQSWLRGAPWNLPQK